MVELFLAQGGEPSMRLAPLVLKAIANGYAEIVTVINDSENGSHPIT